MATLRALLLALLPLDDEARMMYLIYVAYFVRVLNDRHLTALFGGDTDYSLETAFTRLLEKAEAAGDLRPGVDVALEAERLLALQDGMSSRLLLTMRSAEQAERLLDYHLAELFVR